MDQGNNRGSGSDDRYSSYGAERDERNDRSDRGDPDEHRPQGSRQRQQEAYSGGDWLTHRQQGGSDWQGRGQSQPGQPGAGSDWQASGQQPGGNRWSGQGPSSQSSQSPRSLESSQGSTSVSSSGYGGYEGQGRRYEEGYGEGRYGEYGEGRQTGRQPFGRDTGERNTPQRHAERERWGDWHQEDAGRRGSEWSSQQGSQRDEWAQGRAGWDQPARGGSVQRQGGWEQGREGRQQGRQSQGRQWQGRDTGGSGWEGPTGSEPDMRTHYRGGYGVSDYGNQDQEPPVGQSNQTWQRRAAADWLNERERRERHAAGQGPMRDRGDRGSTGPGGYDPNERAYEHFTGANERSDLNRGYGGAGGSAAARRAQRTGPKGYQRSDERIREDLCERLAMSGRVDVREVEVSVASGVVTLSGTVRDRQQKYRIEDMAEEVFGVKDVHNQIRVTRESAMGGRVGGGMGGNTSGMSGLSGRGAMGDQGRPGGSSLSQGLGSPASQGGTAPSSAAGSTGSLGTGIGSDSGSTAGSGFGSGAMPGTNSGTTSGKSGG